MIDPKTMKLGMKFDFNHYTATTLHNVVWNCRKLMAEDARVVSKCTEYLREMDAHGFCEILPGSVARESRDADGFRVSIELPVMDETLLAVCCYGCFDESKADEQWNKMLEDANQYGGLVNPKCYEMRPKAPYICDVLAPGMNAYTYINLMNGNWLPDWTGDFFKYFAVAEIKNHNKKA